MRNYPSVSAQSDPKRPLSLHNLLRQPRAGAPRRPVEELDRLRFARLAKGHHSLPALQVLDVGLVAAAGATAGFHQVPHVIFAGQEQG